MRPGLVKGLVRPLALTVLLSAALLPAQPQPQTRAAQSQPQAQSPPLARPPAQEGQLDGSEALFTVLAAMNAAGYDSNLDSNANSPVRKRVREAIASKHLDSVDALKKFIVEHHQEDPEAELSQYMSFALSIEGPPDFQYWLLPQEIPPDVRKLDGLNELIADFYSEADIQDLWKQVQPEVDQVIQAYHGGVTQAVLETNAYLRNVTSGARGRRFQIYVDVLGAPNQIQTRSYKYNYFVVVTPSPEPQTDQVRHAYLHYLLDPLSLRDFEQWERVKGVADFAQAAPALDEAYKNDFMLLATECVIKAVESRLAHGAQNRQALVNQAVSQGFVLTAALADGLAVYEKQPESLRFYFPDLIGQINIDREDIRLQKVEFAKEATVHKAKPAPVPAAPVVSGPAKVLAEAEDLYGKRDLPRARDTYRKVLELPAENPVHARAYYGLARIAALDRDPELAEKLFQKTLDMSPDEETKSWAHLYLGRLSDAAGEREEAEKHYRAALAVRGVPEQVKVAAEKGLAQPFQR
jgi:tetratricopeptide (TPR) repeat protein